MHFSDNNYNVHTEKRQELNLTYMDDNVGNEDPEIVIFDLSVIPASDSDKVTFIVDKSDITVLDNDGKMDNTV